ncbi:MAG: hypothetical protein WCJ91_06300 [Actinomycetes bacterium]
MSKKSCPGCASTSGLRSIFYGMPSTEPDPAIYVLGGCDFEDDSPHKECMECGWKG